MNKRLLVLAVAGAFGAAGAASAQVDVTVSGYVESGFVISDDAGKVEGGKNATERKFHTEGEIDIIADVNDNVYVRADLDYNSRTGLPGNFVVAVPNGGDFDNRTLQIEQLFGGVRFNDMTSMRIGRFNNPLGYEHQDAHRRSTYSRSLITEILSDQTALYDNNIEGVALDIDAGPAMVTLAVLDEISGQVNKKNSFLAHVSGEAVPGLNLGLGVLTQEKNGGADQNRSPDSMETLINFNIAYDLAMDEVDATFFLDYLNAGEVIKDAWSVGAKGTFLDSFGAIVRYDFVKHESNDTAGETRNGRTHAWTVGVNWMVADNADLRLEWRNEELKKAGAFNYDDDSVLLSAVFSF